MSAGELRSCPRIVFVGGKGGVGKTSTASALAVTLAGAGRRVLLVSTDPAHSLGHLWGRKIGDEQVVLDDGTGRLEALEIDPRTSARAHVRGVAEATRALVSPELREAVDRHLALAAEAPGALEAATLERLARLIVDGDVLAASQAGTRRSWWRRGADARTQHSGRSGHSERAGHSERVEASRLTQSTEPTEPTELGRYGERVLPWDHVVVDTAPTGHTAQLLAAPEAIGAWLDALAQRRARARRFATAQEALDDVVERAASGRERPRDDAAQARQTRIAAILRDRQRVLHALGHVLADPARCAFLVVTTAERLPVLESVELLAELERLTVPVAGIVVNRVRQGAACHDAVAPITQGWPDVPLLVVPEHPEPPAGPDGVARLARALAPSLPW